MFERTSRLAEQVATSVSRRGFLGSLGGPFYSILDVSRAALDCGLRGLPVDCQMFTCF
jgi:hypothetical protein